MTHDLAAAIVLFAILALTSLISWAIGYQSGRREERAHLNAVATRARLYAIRTDDLPERRHQR